VLVDDFLGYDIERESHVLVSIHLSVEIEIFNVNSHEFGIGSGNDTVEQQFGCGYAGGGCAEMSLG
jgi:hypothetical protein